MNNTALYQLLKIIKHNGNIWDLINAGYEFSQVTCFMNALKHERYIVTNDEGRTLLTNLGDRFILDFETSNNIIKYSNWILNRSEMWQEPIKDTYVYIPKR